MSKKRVYELAKELGIGNKEMIERLEKLGIAVKSPTSTIEDIDLDRVKKGVQATGPQEVIEQRIKSTVIRRRAVRSQVEEVEAADEAPAEPAGVSREETPALTEPLKKAEIPPPPEPKGKPPVLEAVKEIPRPGVETPLPEPVPVPSAGEKAEAVKEQPVKKAPEAPPVKPPPARGETPPAIIISRPAPQTPPVHRMVERKSESPAPSDRKAQPAPPRREEARPPGVRRAEAPQPVRPRPPEPLAPGKKEYRPAVSAPQAAAPLPQERSGRDDLDRLRKKGKKGLEIVVPEQEASRKKSFVKKIVDKNVRYVEEIETVDRHGRWREEKKTQPVRMKKTVITIPKAIKRRVRVGDGITVSDLAKKMGVKAGEVIRKLLPLGLMVSINQSIDRDTASLVAAEFSYQVEAAFDEFDGITQKTQEPTGNLRPRAPVVTIMGHVDHGKTSLLDAIRKTNVIEGEAGGITQAIGAYHVHIKGKDIVFLDTPGHEAFTAMRARGAQVTDIVVLVVAADDGVKEQTIEAINHAREAEVPILVAVNKIDKPGSDPSKIKQTLTEYNLVWEEWGGDTIFCEVSAKKNEGIENLLEMILLQAEVMELKADYEKPAKGVVIESTLDRGRGPVATVLIHEGTLKEGDAFISKTEFGRVRVMYNDQGARVRQAGPSMPVEVIGFSGVPQVGSAFAAVEDEKKAREIGEYLIRKEREKELSSSSKITLEQLYQKIKEGAKDFNVIIKGDVQGSVEAISEALNKLTTPEVRIKVIHEATGAITETDVMLASASDAVIIGFKIRPDGRVSELAEREGVEIKLYNIIYNAIADVKAAMEGVLEPVYREVVQGRAEVRDTFKVSRVGTVAGCYLTEGKIARNVNVKLIRDGVVVYDGKINSLKRFKDDVREVAAGFECGISIDGYNDLKPGDVIEAYQQEKVER